MDRQTLRDWVHRYNELGPEGLNDRSKSGRKVFEGQLKVVWLEKGPETDGLVRWRVQDVKNKIQTNFGVKYSMEGTRRAGAGLPSRFAASASGGAQGEIPREFSRQRCGRARQGRANGLVPGRGQNWRECWHGCGRARITARGSLTATVTSTFSEPRVQKGCSRSATPTQHP